MVPRVLVDRLLDLAHVLDEVALRALLELLEARRDCGRSTVRLTPGKNENGVGVLLLSATASKAVPSALSE